jgi:DNA-binding LacI/PurR family transcriptional regulator
MRAPSVNVDDEGGAYAAAAHLLELGHRQILCLTFEPDYSASHVEKVYGVGQRRLAGYKRAFDAYNVPWSDEFLIPTATTTDGGMDAFRHIWSRPTRPTALVTVADVIAVGVLQAAAEHHVHVPGQLAVIGFDDIPYAKWTNPPLTTVRQPIVEKGELAAQLLLSLIAGTLPPDSQLTLPSELIVRQST